MKKIVVGILSFTILGISVFSYKTYDNYKIRENKIAEVLVFKDVAFKGYSALISGKYKEASRLYGEAYDIHKDDSKTLRDYAEALARTGEPKKAVVMYERGYLKSNYKNEEMLEKLAIMYFKIENYDKAIHYYKEAITRFRPRYTYIEKIILSLEAQGKTDEAMGYYAYVMQKDPTFFKGNKNLEKLVSLYDKDTKALDLLPKYDTDGDIDFLLVLGQKYEDEGLDTKALKAYDKVIAMEPNNQKANHYASDIMLRYGDYSHALEHLSRLTNRDFDVLMKIAASFQEIRNYDKAIEYYEKALKKDNSALLYKNLAASAFRNKDKKRVDKYLNLLKKKDPRMAYNFEHATAIGIGHNMSKQEKLVYHAVNTWYDLKDFFRRRL